LYDPFEKNIDSFIDKQSRNGCGGISGVASFMFSLKSTLQILALIVDLAYTAVHSASLSMQVYHFSY